MPRALIASLLLLALTINTARAQPSAAEPRVSQPELRRPAGRRLLDEAASERQRGRAAPVEREPDLQPVAPTFRPAEADAVEMAPSTPAAQSPDRSANYPFDAPLPAQTPAAQKAAALSPEAVAEDRYPKRPAAAVAESSPAVTQADHEVELTAVQTAAYAEPAQPVDQQQAVEAPNVLPPAAVPNELEAAVEALPQPAEPESAEAGLALAPRGEGEAGPDADGPAKPFGDAKSPLTTMIGSLGLVLAIFFALVWVMRRAAPASLRQMPMDVVEVLGRAPLPGKQQQMHLVRCGRKLLLLASSPTGFTTLTEITEAQEVERLASLCRGELPRVGAATFQQSLSEPAHDPYGRGYGEESIDSAAAALARRLSRSSRLGGSDD